MKALLFYRAVALGPVARQHVIIVVGIKIIHFKAKVWEREMGKVPISPSKGIPLMI